MKTAIILAVICATLLLSSCRERMDVELDGTYTRLVVNGRITTDDTIHWVKLTKSADYFDNTLPVPVSNALVNVSDGTTTFEFLENTEIKGLYQSKQKFAGQPGKTYTLSIQNANVGNGTTDYQATSYLPEIGTIDSFWMNKLTSKDFAPPGSEYAVRANLTDPGATNDFYILRFHRNGAELSDTLMRLSYSDDEMFNGKTITNAVMYFITYTYNMDPVSGMLVIPDSLQNNDTLVLELNSVSKGYYNFITQMQLQYGGTNPLSGSQPANVITNIDPKDKAVGFFTTYSIQRAGLRFKLPVSKKMP